ncbi:MAG: hypothetical protein L3J73_04275, partial [Thermoplasmata archaeon]|nr:hypothetical protein [Thermoplasmata archaeon]
MESWKRVGGALSTDFGFVVTAPKAMPGNAFFVPLMGMSRTPEGGQIQVVQWSERSKKFSPTIKGRPWPGEMGTHREGLASDDLDPAGLYLGTTTGQLLFSNNGAKSWGMVPYNFGGIHSVTVASPTAP